MLNSLGLIALTVYATDAYAISLEVFSKFCLKYISSFIAYKLEIRRYHTNDRNKKQEQITDLIFKLLNLFSQLRFKISFWCLQCSMSFFNLVSFLRSFEIISKSARLFCCAFSSNSFSLCFCKASDLNDFEF